MSITSLTAVICISLLLLLNLSSLRQQANATAVRDIAPLDIVGIRMYGYHEDSIRDYHFGEPAWVGVTEGTPVVINGLVRNQNHTGEHFDYITQIIDPSGCTIRIDLKTGIAVPLDHELGIDSSDEPVIFNQSGTYIVKVFTWQNIATSPEPLSKGAVREIDVLGLL